MLIRYHNSVADHDSFESNLRIPTLIGIDEGAGEVGNIHSTVGFSCDPEIVAYQFGEPCEPGLHSCRVVIGRSAFVVDISSVLVN